MFYKAVKAQHTFMMNRIDNLSEAFTNYKSGKESFPYSKLFDLHDEISAIRNTKAKIELLVYLSNEVVGRLLHYNPKLFSYYEALEQEISSFNIDSGTIASEVTLEF